MSYNTQVFPEKKKDDFVDKNFLLISLEEAKAKTIAEVINNATARKILDHLAKKDCSESELSAELDIPISTIHYNLKQLQTANLVVVEEFHYSKKGKEINHYRLANKYIIIAPKSSDGRFIEALRKVLPVAVIIVAVGAVMTMINLLAGTSMQASKAASVASNQAAPRLMTAAAPTANQAAGVAATNVAEVSRPFMQSNIAAYILIGALAVIIIYFLYEFMRKR
jgi:DNA-binding transcriptional ArsR family regulator